MKQSQEKLNRIYVEHGTGKKLAKIFQCTDVTICNALSGRTHSYLSKKIRFAAINHYGGVEINNTNQ